MNASEKPVEPVPFRDLWAGDRFSLPEREEQLWTKLTGNTARRHSPESRALGARGYGYLGDAVCSFEPQQPVLFQPASV